MGQATLPKVFQVLPKIRDRAVDAAIVDALPHLDPQASAAAFDLLIQRKHVPSMTSLVAAFADLSDPIRVTIAGRARQLCEGTGAAMRSASTQTRSSAIELIVAGNDVASSHLLTDVLCGKHNETREQAASALFDLTVRLCDDDSAGTVENTRYVDACRSHLVAALSEAIRSWEKHHQPAALEAALYLADPIEPALRRKLNDPHTQIANMIGKIIEGTSQPHLAGFVLRALSIEPLRKFAASTITRTTDATFMAAVLGETWCLVDHTIAESCRWLKDGEWSRRWCNAIADQKANFPTTAIDFIAHFGGTPQQSMQRFSILLESPNRAVRRDTLWRLIADESSEATELLANFAGRNGEPLAELAERECHRRSPELQVEAIRTQPSANAPPTPGQVLERFLIEFDRLRLSDRQSLGQKISSLVGNLPAKLTKFARASDASMRSRTIRAAVELGLTGEMSESIFELAHDPDGQVRALAISALVHLPGTTTHRILRDALNDPEPRVQANAIETLGTLGWKDADELVSPKLSSPHNRVRANAVKALLGMQFEAAADALLNMLGETSQSHRLSALWVVERMNLRVLVDRIVEISQTDPDGRVRHRAARVLRTLSVAAPVPSHYPADAVAAPTRRTGGST